MSGFDSMGLGDTLGMNMNLHTGLNMMDADSDLDSDVVPGFATRGAGTSQPAPCITLQLAAPPSDVSFVSGPVSVPEFNADFGLSSRSQSIQIALAHSPSRKRGVRVSVIVDGAASGGFQPAQIHHLEEFVRRGGGLGVAGKVWSWYSGGMFSMTG